MAIHLLKLRQVQAAAPGAKPYWLKDGGSLFLYVTPAGAKLWRYRYRIGKVARTYSVGRFPEMSLQAAREERDWARSLVKHGIHPLAEKKSRWLLQIEQNAHCFQQVAEQWIQANADWSPAYKQQIISYMVRDIYPALGSLPISMIQVSHVRTLLNQVALRGANAAIAVRQWLSQVFNYGAQQGICEHNPAARLSRFIKRPTVRHNPPLAWQDIHSFNQKLQAWNGGHLITKIALRIVALTFVRAVEIRRATWAHVDLENRMWSIPAKNMKMRRPHLVPLSRQVIDLFAQLRALAVNSEYVLPNLRCPSQPVGSTTFNRALESLGYKGQFSVHGFRSTATTLLSLLSYPENRVDLQLAHAKKDASRAPYEHTKYLSSRRLMMQDWADIWDAFVAGATLEQVTQRFGPLSERRIDLLRVVEKEW